MSGKSAAVIMRQMHHQVVVIILLFRKKQLNTINLLIFHLGFPLYPLIRELSLLRSRKEDKQNKLSETKIGKKKKKSQNR